MACLHVINVINVEKIYMRVFFPAMCIYAVKTAETHIG